MQPVIEIGIFVAAVRHKRVESAMREEKAVRRLVDFLSAEIPEIETELAGNAFVRFDLVILHREIIR